MPWRLFIAIAMLCGVLYLFNTQPHRTAENRDVTNAVPLSPGNDFHVESVKNFQTEELSFAPISLPPLPLNSAADVKSTSPPPTEAEKGVTLDIPLESYKIAEATGLVIGAIQLSNKLPPEAPMAMNFRHDGCLLLLSDSLPLDGMKITGLSADGKRLLVFALGHEIGHCYVLTHIVARDPAILPTLAPPGNAYRFDEYVGMIGKYNEFPDLNRWNEEWADAFSIFALGKIYGNEYAETLAREVYALRKDQEKNGSVLVANVYGGHASLAEKTLLTIQSPLDIAEVVKRGRLNTNR